MKLSHFRDAIIADFKALMPAVPQITAHFGPFDLDELQAFVVKAPAIMVSLVGLARTKQVSSRELDADVHCAAFIVTRTVPSLPADIAALNIAENLAGHLSCRKFGTASEPAREIAITNHYSGKLRQTGGMIALFAVEWRQVVRIGASVAVAGPVMPLPREIYAGEERIYEAVDG
jgi:phage gp37-like protein